MTKIFTNTVLDAKMGRVSGCGVYVFRDGDEVFYVGKSSTDLPARLRDHFGYSGLPRSDIGTFLWINEPESNNWNIDVYWSEFLDHLEIDLIKSLRPYLNISYNESHNPLPSKYRTERVITTIGQIEAASRRIR